VDVLSKIKNHRYDSKKTYPTRQIFQTTKVCEHCGSKYKDRDAEERYVQAKIEFRDDEWKLINQLKEDLFVEAKITNNPKAQKLWDIAWQHGHASGFTEVYNYFYEYLDLIK